LGRQILGPAWAAVGEVITLTDHTLMVLAGKQGDAVHTSVLTKPVAGEAHLEVGAFYSPGMIR